MITYHWYGPSNIRRGPGSLRTVHHLLDIQRRNHNRIFVSAAGGLLNEEIDIAILSLASQDSQTAVLPLVSTGDDSSSSRNTSTLRRCPPLDRPFVPLVLSLGGMMETDATDALTL
jgi:hypothetical protein